MDFSFQLYSARNFPPVSDVLALLARLGYSQVEGVADVLDEPAARAAELESTGLTMPTAHFALQALKDVAATVELAETLGIETLICPGIDPREFPASSDDAWVALAETLAALADAYRAAGCHIGWHNHDLEFRPTSSGRLPMEIILDTAPNVCWEMDVAGVVKAGQDPLKWIDRHGDRLRAFHLKDIAPAGECVDEDGWADVGHGTIDWSEVFQAIAAGTDARHLVIEHDNPRDLHRFASRSILAVRELAK